MFLSWGQIDFIGAFLEGCWTGFVYFFSFPDSVLLRGLGGSVSSLNFVRTRADLIFGLLKMRSSI